MITAVPTALNLASGLGKNLPTESLGASKQLNIKEISDILPDSFGLELSSSWSEMIQAESLQALPLSLPAGKLLPGDMPTEWLALMENGEFLQKSGLTPDAIESLRQLIQGLPRQSLETSARESLQLQGLEGLDTENLEAELATRNLAGFNAKISSEFFTEALNNRFMTMQANTAVNQALNPANTSGNRAQCLT